MAIDPPICYFKGMPVMFLALLLLLAAPSAEAQVFQGRPLVEAELIADTTAVVPGQPLRVGLHLRLAPKWHVYWSNPGDSGVATSLALKMPEGFTSGPLQWPLPQRLNEPGGIEVFAYRGETMLITTVTPPAHIDATSVRIAGDAGWLVCEEICIPGKASLELSLPVSDAAQADHAELFARFAGELPSDESPKFDVIWTKTPTGWNIGLRGLGETGRADFFPAEDAMHAEGHTKPVEIVEGGADLTVPISGSPTVHGVLVVEQDNHRGYEISSTTSAAVSSPSAARGSLWSYLLLGLVGGLILNLMPCVLPVISLKIFGFMRQAGDSRASILRHGLAFIAGIFVWFLGLAAVIVALKSAGHEVTWAFQFQNPWFNFAVGAVVFVFALNLFGVFEIVLPGRAATGLAEAAGHGGLAGSFAQGVFATLLATPCTAPFLGTALGFAFGQTTAVIFAMFASVAAGMGLPYLLLSAQPGWMKFLPKPGGWMERLKQFMGFPLLATLLWLLYVIGQQRGTDALIWAAAVYLFLGMAAWLYGAFLGPISSRRARTLASLAIIACLALGPGYFGANLFAHAAATGSSPQSASSSEGIPWVPYSQKELDRLLAEGKSVFVDFTADWCLTCKFNERTAINTAAVRAAFTQLGIVPMKGDWTNSNPEITRKLAQFDRVGVPFYLFYQSGNAENPVILPELLTEQKVLQAIGAQPSTKQP